MQSFIEPVQVRYKSDVPADASEQHTSLDQSKLGRDALELQGSEVVQGVALPKIKIKRYFDNAQT